MKITSFVSAALLVASSAFAMSFSYDVVLKNELASTVAVKLRQYHAVGFDGTRPSAWSDDLLVYSGQDELLPGEQKTVTFDDATGGYWVVWSASDYGTGRPLCEGEVDFTNGRSPYSVSIKNESCGKNR